MVVIVGQFGLGKFMLMNIFGCLDWLICGSYQVVGCEIGSMLLDELVELCCEYFGFIFQCYYLLGDFDVCGNVVVLVVYVGSLGLVCIVCVEQFLQCFGFGDCMYYKFGQLFGGQQQCVLIVWVLMNGGEVILVDELIGVFDMCFGEEVMVIFGELYVEGYIIIIVIYDMLVVEYVQCIIEICDGEIIVDCVNVNVFCYCVQCQFIVDVGCGYSWCVVCDCFIEVFWMVLLVMNVYWLCIFLIMFGIIIGIVLVVLVVVLGNGLQQQILQNISVLGINIIDVYFGCGFGDMCLVWVQMFKVSDVDVLVWQSYVDSVMFSVFFLVIVWYCNQLVIVQVSGVGEQFFWVKGVILVVGSFFDCDVVCGFVQVVVIDENICIQFFFNGEDLIGQVILFGNVLVCVVGVVQWQSFGFGGSISLSVWVFYIMVMLCMFGQSYVFSIIVWVDDSMLMDVVQVVIFKLLVMCYGIEDFFFSNSVEICQIIEQIMCIMILLISVIVVIVLLVGGIGVMNIMLVLVIECICEIGVCMVVGVCQSDICQQFLIEVVLVCLFGGLFGVGLLLVVGWLFGKFVFDFQMLFLIVFIVVVFVCFSLIGVVFGFLLVCSVV